jgi:signal transduction histidine kinase
VLDFDEPFPEVDGDLSTLIFRVTQESLSNIAKHAGATHVEVGLHRRAVYLTLAIRDDGRGCDPQAAFAASSEGRSSGLGGMRDRVRLFGGTLRLDSKAGAGSTVSAQFPLGAAAERSP